VLTKIVRRHRLAMRESLLMMRAILVVEERYDHSIEIYAARWENSRKSAY